MIKCNLFSAQHSWFLEIVEVIVIVRASLGHFPGAVRGNSEKTIYTWRQRFGMSKAFAQKFKVRFEFPEIIHMAHWREPRIKDMVCLLFDTVRVGERVGRGPEPPEGAPSGLPHPCGRVSRIILDSIVNLCQI